MYAYSAATDPGPNPCVCGQRNQCLFWDSPCPQRFDEPPDAAALAQEKRERMQEARRRGGLTRAKQFTAASQAAASRAQSRESKVRAARAGAQVTLARHGAITLVEKLVAYRLAKPSRPEQAGIALLAGELEMTEIRDSTVAQGSYFEREVPVDAQGLLRLDLGNRHDRWAIEIRGGCHNLWDTPAHEAARMETIRAAGWAVLVIEEADLVNSSGRARYALGLVERVRAFIQQAIEDRMGDDAPPF